MAALPLTWTAGEYDARQSDHQAPSLRGVEVSSFQFSCAATDWADIPDSAPNEANATSYTVRNLENGTEYAFRVRAVNEDGGGIASNDATATPMATAPDARRPHGGGGRQIGDAEVDGGVGRGQRGHFAPVPAEDDGSLRGLARYPGERGGKRRTQAASPYRRG